jgi:hypothetical protein
MTRSLSEDFDLFVRPIRKTHPGTKGVVIGLAFPSSSLVLTGGDLKGAKATICNSVRQH